MPKNRSPTPSRFAVYRATVSELRAASPGGVYLEWVHCLGAWWWAYLFALPGSLFATNPSFGGLAHHAPEWQWGLTLAGVALCVTVGLVAPYPILRMIGLSAAAGVWAGISACFASSAPVVWHTPMNSGVGIYGALSAVTVFRLYGMSMLAVLDVQTIARALRRSLTRYKAAARG